MFGYKVRNWMENHILKSRKKSNKNKNIAAGNVDETYLITANSTAKDYVFNNCDLNNHKKSQNNKKKNNYIPTSYHVAYNGNAASPASDPSVYNKRANTNPSSITNGNSVISSPGRRREIPPIHHSNLSRYGWLSPKLKYGIHDATQTYVFNSDGHIFDRAQKNSAEPNPPIRKSLINCYEHQQQKEFLIQHQLNCSTSSCSSPTWSTGSKDTSLLRSNQTQGIETTKKGRTGTILTESNDYQHNDSITTDGSDYLANDLIKQNCENFETIVRQTDKLFTKHDLLQDCQRERPKSEQFYHSQRYVVESSPGYGRLLPSKLANSMLINFSSGTETCGSHNSLHTKSTLPPYHCMPPLLPTFQLSTASYNFLSDYKTISTPGAKSIQETTNNECIENNCKDSGQPLINLSSPESAYSTGYSTDGTSQNVPHSTSEIHSNGRKINNHYTKSINSIVVEGQRYKFGLNKIEEMSPLDPLPKTPFMQSNSEYSERHEPVNSYQTFNNNPMNRVEMKNPNNTLSEQQQFMLAGYQSSSPRQRCRIRTNPWISTIDPLIVNDGLIGHNQTNTQQNRNNSKKTDENSPKRYDSYQTSEGNILCKKLQGIYYSACPTTDNSNNTHAVYKHSCACYADNLIPLNHIDAKFKGELIAKCVQNYSYEKETDILSSESDLTDKQLSVDTGLDAEDECDSEDDREFIDASLNTSVINYVRRKRYLKTCKKNSKGRNYQRIRENGKSRETRSAGGTPVCLRKRTSHSQRFNGFKPRYMSERANSMIFADEKINQNIFVKMDDDDIDVNDETILSKADLEADMKYRQLIIEAEILIVTMGHSMQSLNQKALSNPCKANERRRIIQKSQSELGRHPKQNQLHQSQYLLKDSSGISLVDGKIRNLKSSRNSNDYHRISLCSPQRTHLTNFLNQNNSSTDFNISNRIMNKYFDKFSSKENTT